MPPWQEEAMRAWGQKSPGSWCLECGVERSGRHIPVDAHPGGFSWWRATASTLPSGQGAVRRGLKAI